MTENNRRKKSFSRWSAIFGLVGMFLIIMPFTSIYFFQYFSILLSGLVLYAVSFILSIIALVKRERTVLVLVPFVLLLPFALLLMGLGPMIGIGSVGINLVY